MISFNGGDYLQYFRANQQDVNLQSHKKPNVLTQKEANELREEILEYHASRNPNRALQEATSNMLDENLANEVANALGNNEWYA